MDDTPMQPRWTSLREALTDSARSGRALGHFNVSDLVALRAVTEASRELGAPVLVGVSEGERQFLGVRQVAALVASIRDEFGQAIFLNADHTHSLEKAEDAARAGFDEILFDGAALPFEDNVRRTRAAVEAIRSIDPSIVVEGEIGWIGASSEVHDAAPAGLERGLTTPEQARQFIDATGVDVLAPAVGTMHGLLQSMVRGEAEKRLDLERIRRIKRATCAFLTLHGASGTNAGDLQEAIRAGINIIHINTELRLAWRRGLEAALKRDASTLAPYSILVGPLVAIKDIVRSRLQLFRAEHPGTSPGSAERDASSADQ